MWFRGSTIFCVGILLLAVVLTITAVERTFFRRGARPQDVREAQRRVTLEADQVAGIGAEQREAVRLLSEASAEIDEALRHIETWDSEIVPLGENAAGQSIGDDTKLTDQMAYLFGEERPLAEELKAAEQRIADLRESVERLAAKSTPTRLPAADMAEIRELHEQARSASQDWGKAVRAAQAIVRKAKPAPPKKGRSLDERMQERNDQIALEELEDKRQREKEEAEEAARIAKAREELKEEATSAEVKQVLAPFLARRFVQPKLSGAAILTERVAHEQPMSLSRLEAIGVLADSVEGRKMLARVGTDRDFAPPRWTFPSEPGNWTPDNQRFLQRAQDMLRRYGPVLVEAGLLSP